MNTVITCPSGHFLGEVLIAIEEVTIAERRRCRSCKQDVFVMAANGVVQVRRIGDRPRVV